jgi:branched-chain amino acid transport system permease protein
LADPFSGFYQTYSADISRFGISALLALSIYITLACGVLSLANAALLGIGAYTAALLTLHEHWPLGAAVLAGGAAAALIAVPLALPVLRLRGVFLAIATIGFGEIVRIFFVNWAYAGGALGLAGVPPLTDWWHIYTALALVLFVLWRLRGSRAGYALEAIRQDETIARTMGIDVTSYKLLTFVAGAFVAGVAGGLQAHLLLIVDPNDYGFQRAVEILTYAIVGGIGNFVGPVLGAGLITLLPEVLRNLSSAGISPGAVRQFVSGVILLLVILYAPGGLVTVLDRAAGIIARRTRLSFPASRSA